jgi:hypothetical protein
MIRARTVLCAVVFLVLPLLSGCGEQKSVEDMEPEAIRRERRMKHEKIAPKDARPADASPGKK